MPVPVRARVWAGYRVPLGEATMPLTIRRGVPSDTALVADMNARMAQETEHRTLDLPVLTAGVRTVLSDPGRGLYFIAEKDEAVVGQAMVTLEWSDWRNGWLWWIQSVYVHPEARRQGVFTVLYRHILEAAKAAGDVVGLRLYVEQDNRAAQNTYLKLGMERTRYQLLERCPLWSEVEMVQQIDVHGLAERLAKGDPVYLVDVRQQWEHDTAALPGSRLIPLDQLSFRAAEIEPAP